MSLQQPLVMQWVLGSAPPMCPSQGVRECNSCVAIPKTNRDPSRHADFDTCIAVGNKAKARYRWHMQGLPCICSPCAALISQKAKTYATPRLLRTHFKGALKGYKPYKPPKPPQPPQPHTPHTAPRPPEPLEHCLTTVSNRST